MNLPQSELTMWSHLPMAARADANRWYQLLNPFLSPTHRGLVKDLRQIAKDTRTSYTNVARKFYALKSRGIIGLVDRRVAGPDWWDKSDSSKFLPPPDKAAYEQYFERAGSARKAAEQMRKDWKLGRLKTSQPVDARTGFPVAWSVANLSRYAPPTLKNVKKDKFKSRERHLHELVQRLEILVGEIKALIASPHVL